MGDAGVVIDDPLNAFSLVLTAVSPSDQPQILPDSPPTDEESLPMHLVARHREPLDPN